MQSETIAISKAKSRLLELSRLADEEGRAFVLTKDGRAVSALLPIAVLEALLETAEILEDDDAMASLEEALDDVKCGRLYRRDDRGRWISDR